MQSNWEFFGFFNCCSRQGVDKQSEQEFVGSAATDKRQGKSIARKQSGLQHSSRVSKHGDIQKFNPQQSETSQPAKKAFQAVSSGKISRQVLAQEQKKVASKVEQEPQPAMKQTEQLGKVSKSRENENRPLFKNDQKEPRKNEIEQANDDQCGQSASIPQNGFSIMKEENKSPQRHRSTKDQKIQSVFDNKNPEGPECEAARNLNSSQQSFKEMKRLELVASQEQQTPIRADLNRNLHNQEDLLQEVQEAQSVAEVSPLIEQEVSHSSESSHEEQKAINASDESSRQQQERFLKSLYPLSFDNLDKRSPDKSKIKLSQSFEQSQPNKNASIGRVEQNDRIPMFEAQPREQNSLQELQDMNKSPSHMIDDAIAQHEAWRKRCPNEREAPPGRSNIQFANKPVLCLSSDYESSISDMFQADRNEQIDIPSNESYLKLKNEDDFPQSQHFNNGYQFLLPMQINQRVALVAEAEPNQRHRDLAEASKDDEPAV